MQFVAYFLVVGMPCRIISRSARSATPACSPIASRRIRSWQGWQIPPLITSAGLPQIMHFLLGSLVMAFLGKLSFVKPLVNQPYLVGILDDNLHAVLRMVFDLTGNLDFLMLETLRRRLGFIE